jgi:1-pyrroline-5-carboxylate dehydrogenase
VFNYLGGTAGELGQALVAHPLTAGVTFTGSHAVGMQIARQLAAGPYPRPLIAEMGGKNACIVTAGANLEHATAGIARSAFGMCGQKCSALSRLYVHERVAEDLIARLASHMAGIRIGDPLARENWLGPLATPGGYERYAGFARQLATGGARTIAGSGVLRGGAHDGGYFVSPLLAEAPPDHPLWRTEMFAPVLMVHRVQSNAEAMRLANDSVAGLTAGFYGTRDEILWFQQNIEAGVTLANRPQGATTGAWPGYQAFAGWKGSSSTCKAIGSFYYLPQYMREQSLTVVE